MLAKNRRLQNQPTNQSTNPNQLKTHTNYSFLSSVLFSSSEDRERARKIAEKSTARQFFALVQSKLNSMSLTASEKDIEEALAQHEPLRHKDAHTVAIHAVAHLVERGLTHKQQQQQQTNKKKRSRDEDEGEQGQEDDDEFPGPPPGLPPVISLKKRRTETGSRSVSPPPVPFRPSSRVQQQQQQQQKQQQDETIPSEVFEYIEKRPENYILKIFKSLQIPPNDKMASLMNGLIIALHDRNGGNALTPAERKKLGTSVCEYLFAIRYRSTDVNAATASAKKTIHELSNQVQMSNHNPTHDEVEKLLSSSESLFECWNHLFDMVQSRRSAKGIHPSIRRKLEESVSSIRAERSRMQNVIQESSTTIQKTNLRMHSLDTFIDKYVPDNEENDETSSSTSSQQQQQHTKIQVGTVVLSPYKQKSAFYRGHVQAINLDGTLRIKYDDGDLDRSIPAHMVHIEGLAPAPKPKPRSTTSIMNFLDQAKDDPKLSEALDLRKKLHSKIRSQKCRISHAKLVLRILDIIEQISAVSLKQRSILADKGLKNVTDEMSNISNLVIRSATAVATSVTLASENLFKRKSMIEEDLNSIVSELERHCRVYGESAPKRKEDIEQRLKEVRVVMEKCDNSLDKIASSIRSFTEKRSLSFPSGSALKFYESFEMVWQKLRDVMSNKSDSNMSSVIAACRALSHVSSKACRKEEVEAVKHAMQSRKKMATNDDEHFVDVDDDVIVIDDDEEEGDVMQEKGMPVVIDSAMQESHNEVYDETEEQGCVVM